MSGHVTVAWRHFMQTKAWRCVVVMTSLKKKLQTYFQWLKSLSERRIDLYLRILLCSAWHRLGKWAPTQSTHLQTPPAANFYSTSAMKWPSKLARLFQMDSLIDLCNFKKAQRCSSCSMTDGVLLSITLVIITSVSQRTVNVQLDGMLNGQPLQIPNMSFHNDGKPQLRLR